MSFPLIIASSHGGSGPHLMHSSLGPPESITQTASRSVQPFLHSSRQNVPKLYSGCPFPQKLPLSIGDLDPHLIHDSLGPSKPKTQTASQSIGSAVFAQMTAVSLYFTMRCRFPIKSAPFHGDMNPHQMHGFLGPLKSLTQMAS